MNNDILFDYIKNGSKVEQDTALQQLYERVEESNQSPDSLNELALGLQLAKKFADSANIFEQLVRSFPKKDVYRLSLATTYSQIPEIELCKYHLEYLVEHGSTEEMRKMAQQQLSGYIAFLGQNEQDQRLRQLQIDSLRNNIRSGQANSEDYLRLGRFLLLMQHKDPNERWLDDATSVLEEGHTHFPTDVMLMENLVLCYLGNGQDSRLDGLIKELEKQAPHSDVFEIMSDLDEKQNKVFAQQKLNYAYALLDRVQSGDQKLKMAALHELQRMVSMGRTNPIIYL
jgi:hypothetical protein